MVVANRELLQAMSPDQVLAIVIGMERERESERERERCCCSVCPPIRS